RGVWPSARYAADLEIGLGALSCRNPRAHWFSGRGPFLFYHLFALRGAPAAAEGGPLCRPCAARNGAPTQGMAPPRAQGPRGRIRSMAPAAGTWDRFRRDRAGARGGRAIQAVARAIFRRAGQAPFGAGL